MNSGIFPFHLTEFRLKFPVNTGVWVGKHGNFIICLSCKAPNRSLHNPHLLLLGSCHTHDIVSFARQQTKVHGKCQIDRPSQIHLQIFFSVPVCRKKCIFPFCNPVPVCLFNLTVVKIVRYILLCSVIDPCLLIHLVTPAAVNIDNLTTLNMCQLHKRSVLIAFLRHCLNCDFTDLHVQKRFDFLPLALIQRFFQLILIVCHRNSGFDLFFTLIGKSAQSIHNCLIGKQKTDTKCSRLCKQVFQLLLVFTLQLRMLCHDMKFIDHNHQTTHGCATKRLTILLEIRNVCLFALLFQLIICHCDQILPSRHLFCDFVNKGIREIFCFRKSNKPDMRRCIGFIGIKLCDLIVCQPDFHILRRIIQHNRTDQHMKQCTFSGSRATGNQSVCIHGLAETVFHDISLAVQCKWNPETLCRIPFSHACIDIKHVRKVIVVHLNRHFFLDYALHIIVLSGAHRLQCAGGRTVGCRNRRRASLQPDRFQCQKCLAAHLTLKGIVFTVSIAVPLRHLLPAVLIVQQQNRNTTVLSVSDQLVENTDVFITKARRKIFNDYDLLWDFSLSIALAVCLIIILQRTVSTDFFC